MKLNTVQFEVKFELPSNWKTKRFKFEVKGSNLKSKPSQNPKSNPKSVVQIQPKLGVWVGGSMKFEVGLLFEP